MGVSGPQVVEGWYGQPFSKPLARTREVVDIVRKVLAREAPVTNDGPHYPLPYDGEGSVGLGKPLKPIVHPLRADIPIWLGAEGPKNVAQTAEIADGWIPIFYTPKSAGMYQPWLDEGFARPGARRTREDFEIAATCHLQITEQRGGAARCHRRAEARRSRSTWAAWAPRSRTSTRTSSTGWATPRSPTRSRSSSSRASADEATALIPDDLVEDMHIMGDGGYVRERAAQWEETGRDHAAAEPARRRTRCARSRRRSVA